MSTRNLMWLALIVIVAVVGWIAFGPVVAIVAGVAVLIGSEVVERGRRRRRAAAAGAAAPKPLRNAVKRKPERR